MAILSWIIPAGKYQMKGGNIVAGSYHHVAQHPQGLWDVLMAPIIGMVGDKSTEGAISISLFILVIGGVFLAVVIELMLWIKELVLLLITTKDAKKHLSLY